MANIRQVAKLAGVSASTVSRILNDDTSLMLLIKHGQSFSGYKKIKLSYQK